MCKLTTALSRRRHDRTWSFCVLTFIHSCERAYARWRYAD